MVENYKLVVCTVHDGALVYQPTPDLPDVEWVEIPETRVQAGRFFRADFAARVPESLCLNLPANCWIDDRFVHVTKLKIVYQGDKEVLEVCHQEAEGFPIRCDIF